MWHFWLFIVFRIRGPQKEVFSSKIWTLTTYCQANNYHFQRWISYDLEMHPTNIVILIVLEIRYGTFLIFYSFSDPGNPKKGLFQQNLTLNHIFYGKLLSCQRLITCDLQMHPPTFLIFLEFRLCDIFYFLQFFESGGPQNG